MHKTVVINAVGLSANLISAEHTPRLHALSAASGWRAIEPVVPAVTTTVQSSYLTGLWPSEHGAVANGWYFRDTGEVRFWLQSNKLVGGEKVWEAGKRRDPAFTCCNMFWWYNMYSTADYSVTPRPMYPADGRKLPDVYSHPASLRDELQAKLGTFPLFNFWGPATSIKATRWIADASIEVDKKHDPTLTLIYLPHLDYVLQKVGPGTSLPTRDSKLPTDLRDLDSECGKLIDHYQSRSARVMILSEYGITPVSRPVHLNRVLREAGLLATRLELGREILDPGASRAFAVADHQVAHAYVRDSADVARVRAVLEQAPGVARVLDEAGKRELNLDHARSGELVALAEADAWFTYYFWLDDAKAPDYARTVDIHRKPGYDPVELFLDPAIRSPKLKIGWTLAKRKLGMRAMMDVIPLDAGLVKGSHGLAARTPEEGAMLMTTHPALVTAGAIAPTGVKELILRHVFDE
ncbi:MAG TPA: nucleotide pyrophosphatase/phosphodiesterase family protein [Tepidisphaeraceae bacterium]|nr:nucleotide pyrophosphatase/phosphodiesterase family protein [Tepidisphaeraceae bacterium]